MISNYAISEKWIKSSIIGTTWAASEIVLGSFLHNLKIPFSSNLLTGIGIVILISSSYIWKEKGLFWRAGLICAIMKTMSPSAVIFGPMIAIFSQAALLEVSSRVFGRTLFGFIFGSMLAMSWNLFQKIMNFIIFYGANIVDVYVDLIKYAQKQLHVTFDMVWLPILLLLSVYCLLGLLSAIIGIKVGKKLLKQPAVTKSKPLPENRKKTYESTTPQHPFHYSIFWLFINIAFIITALVLLNFAHWLVWGIAIVTISTIWIIRYKRAFRQLSKPRFWVSFVVITMITAFVFNKMQSQSIMNGLLIGIQMNFRAVTIILGFSVLGTELYNPVIRELFLKTSFKQLPLALELSFTSLPMMIGSTPEVKVILKNPVSVLYQLIAQIEIRLAEMKEQHSLKTFIISGAVGAGKTTLIQKTVAGLKERNISVGGILSARLVEEGNTVGYDIVNLMTHARVPFLRTATDVKSISIGKYTILPEGLEAGLTALREARINNCQLIVVDEIGKLELENKGWADQLNDLSTQPNTLLLFSVRDSFVDQVIQKWDLKDHLLLPVSEYNHQDICSHIVSVLLQ